MADNRYKEYVDYTDGTHFGEDGINVPIRKRKVIEMNFTRRYYNCIYLLAGLRPASRNLMDFITEEMDNNNIIYNNKFVREKFIHFMKEITSLGGVHDKPIVYTDQTVKDCFLQLSETGLIISKSKGTYKVNPEYFFKSSETERMGSIMLEMEFSGQADKFSTRTTFKEKKR